jgi:hypothetical protein
MNDDLSNIVRSGTEHHVSVSEHTGNAKNPKNIVTSHEEETAARKLAFEQKALAALEAEKALAAALTEHIEHVAPEDDARNANIQSIANDQAAENLQALSKDGASAPNVQSIAADATDPNRQQITSTAIGDNIQSVGNAKGIAPNVQSVPLDAIAANHQKIEGSKAIQANIQGIATDAITANLQKVGGGIASNLQAIGNSGVAANQQTLPQDSVGLNRQGLPTDGYEKNQQRIAKDATSANEQETPTDALSLNRQAVPQDVPASPNLQGVDNAKIGSHFEPLPAGTGELKKVDFPAETAKADGHNATTGVSDKASLKPVAKAAPATRTPVTAAALQEAHLKREQMNDAFHGRLAGIKHNVDALNNRLSDFEEKVHQENLKLDKGNPDDFEVNLD